jgi:hypothetical protein
VQLWDDIRSARCLVSDSLRKQCRLMVYQYWQEPESQR